MITSETKKQLETIKTIFNNNNLIINFEGVQNTPFIKKISCNLKMDDLKNINKIKTVIKTIESLLNTSINYYFNDDLFIIELKQKNKNIYKFESYFKTNESIKNHDFIFLGLNQELNPVFKNIHDLKSILIGGSSGSGKSNLLHNIILSYLLLNDKNYLFLIDPKYTELNFYNKSILKNRLVLNPAHEKKDILKVINAYINLIKTRFQAMQKAHQQTSTDPTCLLIIDEYAALFNTTKEKNIINEKIAYISSIGRAARCYLILTTQHPTNANINNTIRSNLQTRIALHCESVQQSNNIIGTSEAVRIIPPGELVFKSDDGIKQNLKTCFISNNILNQILKASK